MNPHVLSPSSEPRHGLRPIGAQSVESLARPCTFGVLCGEYRDHNLVAFFAECIAQHISYIDNADSLTLCNRLCFDDFHLRILDISFVDFIRITICLTTPLTVTCVYYILRAFIE